MKISRFIVVAVFGLGLISQSSFSYDNVDYNNKMTHKTMTHKTMKHHDKIACEKSVLPLFNKEEDRPCKKGEQYKKTTDKKHVKAKYGKKHEATCGQDCHRSILPLFNSEENRTCICPNADENMVNKNDTMTYKTDKKMNYGTTKTMSTKYNKN